MLFVQVDSDGVEKWKSHLSKLICDSQLVYSTTVHLDKKKLSFRKSNFLSPWTAVNSTNVNPIQDSLNKTLILLT